MAPLTFDALCQQARQAIAERDWEKARQSYLQALGLKSDVPDIHQGLATVCFQLRPDQRRLPLQGSYPPRSAPPAPTSTSAPSTTCSITSTRPSPPCVAASNSTRSGPRATTTSAWPIAARARSISPSTPTARPCASIRMADAHYNLANLHLDKEQYAQAVAAYKQALQIRPTWDKAQQGLASAAEALAEESAEKQAEESAAEEPVVAATETTTGPAPIDPHRVIDPDLHGPLLNSLHKATAESENHGRHFFRLVKEEIEPVIKELSSCLIAPDFSISVLDACIQKFEDALLHVKSARANLQGSIERVRLLGDKLVSETN